MKEVFVDPNLNDYARKKVGEMLGALRATAKSEHLIIISKLQNENFARRKYLDSLLADMFRSLFNTPETISIPDLKRIAECIVLELPRRLPFVEKFDLPDYFGTALMNLIFQASVAIEQKKRNTDWFEKKKKIWHAVPEALSICVYEIPEPEV